MTNFQSKKGPQNQKKRRYPSIAEVKAKYGDTPFTVSELQSVYQRLLILFIFDVSGSMSNYYKDLVWSFSNVILPALKGAKKETKGIMRIGCLLFAEKIVRPWKGFITLEEATKRPLLMKDITESGFNPDLNHRVTALYDAMIEGASLMCETSCRLNKGAATRTKALMLTLTDGKNNKGSTDPAAVKTIISAHNDFASNLAYFNTAKDGLSPKEIGVLSRQLGCQKDPFYGDRLIGGTDKERQRMFRAHMETWSKQNLT